MSNPSITSRDDRWLLPEGIEEVLPPQAARLERMRRQLLDLYASWGYELVMPPFIEYLESLLTGTGNDLDLQTFKLTDQLTGRLMGVRADMTPQVARIDAHRLRRDVPTRLCYMGTVLHTRPDGFAGSRSPLQVGAELYGHAGPESDTEVLCLMHETLISCGLDQAHLDLGHVGIYRGLARQAGLGSEQEALLFDALQRKARSEIESLLDEFAPVRGARAMLLALSDLNGGEEVLADAREVLRTADAEVQGALENLSAIARNVRRRLPAARIHFDLAELRGYRYHTGAVFAAFVPGRGQAIAQGGRYDRIGEVFGRARPATGFSTDLKTLSALSVHKAELIRPAILAPHDDDPALQALVAGLRRDGERVIAGLPGDARARELGCDRVIARHDEEWRVVGLAD